MDNNLRQAQMRYHALVSKEEMDRTIAALLAEAAVQDLEISVQVDPSDYTTRERNLTVDAAKELIYAVDESVVYLGEDWFLLILENGADVVTDYRGSPSADSLWKNICTRLDAGLNPLFCDKCKK